MSFIETSPKIADLFMEYGARSVEEFSDSSAVPRRDYEDLLLGIFLKYYKHHPLLIGETGCGKTALVESLLRRFASGDVPEPLKKTDVYFLKFNYLNDRFFEVLSGLETELQALERNSVLLVLDDFYFSESYMRPISELMKAYNLHILLVTTAERYSAGLKNEERIISQVHEVTLRDPSASLLEEILRVKKETLAKHYSIAVPRELLPEIVKAAKEPLLKGSLVRKALDVLDSACSAAVLGGSSELKPPHVAKAMKLLSGFGGLEDADYEDGKRLEGLEKKLERSIVGQSHAIRAVCNVVRLAKNGLDLRPERPDGVFLFTGPTGVGKTALAAALAEALTGSENGMIRLDMSEYHDSHLVSRLIGSPPGYTGSEADSLLSTLVKGRATGILLLDEFEKAHPQIHQFFLQVFDAGRATDNKGVFIDFSRMTVIATCNVNAEVAGRIRGFEEAGASKVSGELRIPWAELKKIFSPELLNRFDEIIPFRPLDEEACLTILSSIIIPKAREKLLARLNLEVNFTNDAVRDLLAAGYSRDFGMRNIHRTFQTRILSPLMKLQVEGRGGKSLRIVSCDPELKTEEVRPT